MHKTTTTLCRRFWRGVYSSVTFSLSSLIFPTLCFFLPSLSLPCHFPLPSLPFPLIFFPIPLPFDSRGGRIIEEYTALELRVLEYGGWRWRTQKMGGGDELGDFFFFGGGVKTFTKKLARCARKYPKVPYFCLFFGEILGGV